MAADEKHLGWKSDHLSAKHTLANTEALTKEAEDVLRILRSSETSGSSK